MPDSINSLTKDLTSFIRSNYSPEEKTQTSKDGRQTIFFRKSEKSLCYIEISEKKSIVTVVIGASLADKVASANISGSAKKMFMDAKQFHDGRWLFFDIKTKQDIDDIKSLLLLKKAPKNNK